MARAASRLTRLKRLAKLLEESLDEASVGVRAQLAAQYRATLADIEEIEGAQSAPAGKKGTALDELNARRAARQPGSARQA